MKTKKEIRAEALARGEEASYSGKKRKWFFKPTFLSQQKKGK